MVNSELRIVNEDDPSPQREGARGGAESLLVSPSSSTSPLLSGAMIGILGSGQLGRMLALEARAMGYRVAVFSPGERTPAGVVADVEVCADYGDLAAVRDFARLCDVVTYEFENVPAATAAACEEFAPLRPGTLALRTAQDRVTEKRALGRAGLPVAQFAVIDAAFDERSPIFQKSALFPGILKTSSTGYDGKGQVRVEKPSELMGAWELLGRADAVLEAVVPFVKEVSVVAARGLDGAFVDYGVLENEHVNHILDVTVGRGDLITDDTDRKDLEELNADCAGDAGLRRRVVGLARKIFEALEIVGTACVEFFVLGNGEVLINEIAPRPHNSGHLTIDACVTSQFGQQLRAICGLPLGSTAFRRPAAMVNLLGDLWVHGEPEWARVLALPDVHLHLYGKQEARIGRKMGHITVLGQASESVEDLRLRALQTRELLTK